MRSKKGRLVGVFVIYAVANNGFSEAIDNPCAGASALLNLVNRPTVSDSACAVPYNKALVELGFQYQGLTQSAGQQTNFPEAVVRFGLPFNNELALVLPNYNHPSMQSPSGFSTTTATIKHQIGYTEHWLGSIETGVTLASGSQYFGSDGNGIALNGIVSYTFNSKWSLLFMLGLSSQVESSFDGGRRYTTTNPDLVLTYVVNPKINMYAEVYGQSRTGPEVGSGFNTDAGILYLPFPNVEVDLAFGQHVSGTLGSFNQYIGAGMAILF